MEDTVRLWESVAGGLLAVFFLMLLFQSLVPGSSLRTGIADVELQRVGVVPDADSQLGDHGLALSDGLDQRTFTAAAALERCHCLLALLLGGVEPCAGLHTAVIETLQVPVVTAFGVCSVAVHVQDVSLCVGVLQLVKERLIDADDCLCPAGPQNG